MDTQEDVDALSLKVLAALEQRGPANPFEESLEKTIVGTARQRKLIDFLNAILVNATDSDNCIRDVLTVRNLLLRSGIEHPDPYLYPENIALHDELIDRMMIANNEAKFAQYDAELRDYVARVVLTADPANQPLVIEVIIGRGVTDESQIAQTVEELRSIKPVLLTGGL